MKVIYINDGALLNILDRVIKCVDETVAGKIDKWVSGRRSHENREYYQQEHFAEIQR
jgi:hypothetical protein